MCFHLNFNSLIGCEYIHHTSILLYDGELLKKFILFFYIEFECRDAKAFPQKKHKSGLLFSSKKQLDKSKMAKCLHRASRPMISSNVQTLSYEDHRVEIGDSQPPSKLTQYSHGTNIAKLDCVDESEENIHQSSPRKNDILLASTKLVSSSIYCYIWSHMQFVQKFIVVYS